METNNEAQPKNEAGQKPDLPGDHPLAQVFEEAFERLRERLSQSN